MNYLYSTEIYPTEVRQIGLGVNSAVSRVGSMLSPFVKELNDMTHVSVSMGLFASAALVNTFLVLLLPETRGKDIPDTIDQIESKFPFNGKSEVETSTSHQQHQQEQRQQKHKEASKSHHQMRQSAVTFIRDICAARKYVHKEQREIASSPGTK